ncbi:MAG: NAD(P)H-hydrate dehydratase [Clostridiales bacterium]|nr:NAD(P)H-hydrate dehydratase [Clostridiales bacterium]
MQYLVSGTKMKEIDKITILEIGIPSMVLMERAALFVSKEVEDKTSSSDRILCLCGIGNNGADGIAAARILSTKGRKVDVCVLGDSRKATEEWKSQFEVIKKMNIPVINIIDNFTVVDKTFLRSYNFIIDAIYGIGINRPLEGVYKSTIDVINESGIYVIAVDIPSGINADTGKVMGTGIVADQTITFGYKKIGITLYPGALYAGEIKVCDIGFLKQTLNKVGAEAFTYEESDLAKIPRRDPYGNKGTFGKVLVIAGSKNMSGAAYFAGKAAYKMGAGLVGILSSEVNRAILQTKLPEAILTTYEGNELLEEHTKAIEWADVIIIGPGLGKSNMAKELVTYVLKDTNVPLVIDADGLNIISENTKLKESLSNRCIITPHLGEMTRLAGLTIDEIRLDIVDCARTYASQNNIVCVLKDARTIVASQERQMYINTNGNSGMATGGSGDVLTGIIAGLLAMGLECFTAASLGVFIHGLAGDKAKEVKGEYGMMASDILDGLELK